MPVVREARAAAHSAEFNAKFWSIGLSQMPHRLPTLCIKPALTAPSWRSAGQTEFLAMLVVKRSAQF